MREGGRRGREGESEIQINTWSHNTVTNGSRQYLSTRKEDTNKIE